MKRSVILILTICSIVTTGIIVSYGSHVLNNQNNPDLIITYFKPLQNVYAGRDAVFEMDLSNQGAVTAKNCTITLFDGIPSSPPITSKFFDVMSESNHTSVEIKSGIYHSTGLYHVKAELGCINTTSQSTLYDLAIAQ